MPTSQTLSPILLKIRPRHSGGAFERIHEPVSLGVPFPRGLLESTDRLQLRHVNGKPVPAQYAVTERWGDGSVRWVLLDFQVLTDSTGQAVYQLEICRDSQTRADASMEIREGVSDVRLETGALMLSCDDDGNVFLSTPGSSEQWALSVNATDQSGEDVRVAVGRTRVESAGPLTTRLKLSRTLVLAGSRRRLALTIRLQVFHALPTLKVSLSVHNPARARHPGGIWELGDAGSVLLQSLSVRLGCVRAESRRTVRYSEALDLPWQSANERLRIYQDSSGGEHWDHPSHIARDGTPWPRFRGYEVSSDSTSRHGLRATPIVELVEGDRSAVSMTMESFWENWPKAIEADGKSVSLGLFPRAAEHLHEIQGGERKRHDFAVCVGPDPVTGHTLAWAREPVVVIVPPEWYRHCVVLPFLVSPLADPTSEGLVHAAVEGPESFFAKRERSDEYGWRDWGELPADHEAVGAKGLFVSHYNNQYDAVVGFARQFMRTGDLRWFGLMSALARHVADIDIYHTREDKAAYNGGLFWHTYHYVDAGRSTHRSYPSAPGVHGGGPSSEHDYAEGLAIHHALTGDPDSREAVLELADWVVAMDDGRQSVFRWLDSGRTGLASATASMAYHGPGRGAGNSILTLITAARLKGNDGYLKKAEEIIWRCIHPADDPASLDLLDAERRWSYTVFLQSLGRYVDYKDERNERDDHWGYARSSLMTYARWMVSHEYFYLDRPEILEYPTETWPAQDLRKAEVFVRAWLWCQPAEREVMRERAEYFFGRAVATLSEMQSAAFTRPLVLLMAYTGSVPWMRLRLEAGEPFPSPGIWSGESARTRFVPQRVRAINRAKTLAFLSAGLALAGVAYWVW